MTFAEAPAQSIAAHNGENANASPSAEFLRLVPHGFARRHLLLSRGIIDGVEHVMIATSTDPRAIFNTAVKLGRRIVTKQHDAEILASAIDAAYEAYAAAKNSDDTTASGTAQGNESTWSIDVAGLDQDPQALDRLLHAQERDLLAVDGKAPLVQLVDRLLFEALQLGASDIHLQPMDDRIVIRRRIDGVLDAGRSASVSLLKPLCSRIKVMGAMDVAESLVPQDGRAGVRIGDRSIDLRISTLPTAYGERVVIRLLDRSRQPARLDALGMADDVAATFRQATLRANGLILVTGPTGSGKTTTLYAALRALDTQTRNLMTIEDPIEYELKGDGVRISQAQVNAKKGVTFVTGLRHILRQDPDVIMVGEIRDAETAHIAVQAALTGHLVFSTLHTNDALSAITRLADLGIDAYKIADCLSLVLAQRLVRTRCTACAGTGSIAGQPCHICHGSGLKGRTGLFEQVGIDARMRQLIGNRSNLDDLRAHARSLGMRTLAEEGQSLIAAGRTTPEEVARVVVHA